MVIVCTCHWEIARWLNGMVNLFGAIIRAVQRQAVKHNGKDLLNSGRGVK